MLVGQGRQRFRDRLHRLDLELNRLGRVCRVYRVIGR
jgi:hypothetical protein